MKRKEKAMIVENLKFKENVIAVITRGDGSKEIHRAKNIIGDEGDKYYAQKSCGETPTNTFANCVLGTGTAATAKTDTYDQVTPIAGSNKAVTAGYPKTNDDDTDNSADKGVDVVTWKFEWAAADFSDAAIAEGCITIAAPTTGSPLLTRWLFAAAFAKDADTTLKIFVNHTANGV